MSAEVNKAVLRRYINELNNRNPAILDELVADGFREVVRQAYDSKLAGFPDCCVEVLDMIAEGDQVVMEWTYRGVHRGTYEGIPPTGRAIHGRAITIYRVVNGRITGSRGVSEPEEIWHALVGEERSSPGRTEGRPAS